MNTRRACAILLLLMMNCITLFAVDTDLYASLTDLLEGFIDPNTGLTSFPTLLVPMGGISEGMGTAYAAMSRDSGFIESNPAASSLLEKTELSFYHRAWISDSSMEGVVYSMRFNDLGIGFGGKFLYVPFTAYNEWGIIKANEYISETIGTMNISYNFFSSYYFYGLAAGANIKVAYRNIPDIASLSVYNQSALAAMADVGMQTSFNLLKFYSAQSKNFSAGLVVKNLGLSTLSDEVLPSVATAGIAWSPLRPWTIAADFNYPFTLSSDTPAESWNVAVGTTVAVAEFLSVQAGTLIKPSNPRVSVGAALAMGTLSLIMNYNLDMSSKLNPLDKFSVQAKFDLGDSGRKAHTEQAEALYLQGVEEFANGNYARAIELWQEVLTIDPKYTPAADNIRTVQQTMALQEQLQTVITK
jgi:tetratricopeptide (TPR) repeat protein